MRKREGEIRIPSGCAIAAIMDRSGACHNGQDIIKSIALMHERSNGLGGGFAAYGIYPDYADLYAFHIFYESREDRTATEAFLNENFVVEVSEKIPTTKVRTITDEPIIWRYFLRPMSSQLEESGFSEDEYTMRCVMRINSMFAGTFVASSGKNMGAFKGVGYPEELGEFYRIEDYQAWLWTAHGRFPTNTPGWWGGAHPFTLLDWSTVHNGEISSYDANRRYVEMFGYDCALHTDTEAITYLFDLLVRKHGLSQELAAHIMTAPEWDVIEKMPPAEQEFETALRAMYSSALVNGPFSIIIGSSSGMLALNDRLKLRALVAAEKGDLFYLASEEAAIRAVCPDAENARTISGGVPLRVMRYDCADADESAKGGRR
jgi:glutamate synthase domain-containing protein 1